MAISTDPPGGTSSTTSGVTGAGDIVGPLRAWCGLTLVLLARTYRAMLLTLVIAAAVPTAWNWSSYVVRSGSMEPTISVGDVVITKPFSASSPVPVGRVMLFTPPDATRGHKHRLHRVVENLGDRMYVTAGDANRNDDALPVPAASFDGRAIICVPFVGLPLVWLSEGDLTLLFGWVLLTGAALYFSSRPVYWGKYRHGPSGARPPDGDQRDAAAPSQPSARASLRTMLHPGTRTVAMAAVLGGVAALSIGSADAAFSDGTVSEANTWKVALNTSRAISRIQVYDTPSSGGWYQRSGVAVNISATASGGTTVRSITYRVNGGSPVTIRTSSVVLAVSTQGDSIITYFATDAFGAAETPHTAHVKLDNRSPVLAVTSRIGDMTHAQWRAACASSELTGGVCGTVVDPSPGSGIDRVEYVLFRSSDSRCFNGTTWTTAACLTRVPATLTSGTWLASVPDSSLAVARTWYTITTYARDVAGNAINTTRTFSVG